MRKDFATGQAGADLINLWAAVRRIGQREARGEAAAWPGLPPAGKVVSFPDPRRPDGPRPAVGRVGTDDRAGFEPEPDDDEDHRPYHHNGEHDPFWYRGATRTHEWGTTSPRLRPTVVLLSAPKAVRSWPSGLR